MTPKGTGTLVRRFFEGAFIEAGAGVRIREADVRADLAELETRLNRHDEVIALAERLVALLSGRSA